jgi:hypothetical protein
MKLFFSVALIFLTSIAVASAKTKQSADDGWKLFEGSDVMAEPAKPTARPAVDPVMWVISPLAIERRMEASTNPVYEPRESRGLAVGLRVYRRYLVSFEYSRFAESSGNETFHVDREFQDLLAWYRYSFFRRGDFRVTAGAGLGAYQEQVTTYFYDLKQDLNSGNKWTAATGLGLEYEPAPYLVFFLEGRLISGQNLDPNPSPDLMARLSFQF